MCVGKFPLLTVIELDCAFQAILPRIKPHHRQWGKQKQKHSNVENEFRTDMHARGYMCRGKNFQGMEKCLESRVAIIQVKDNMISSLIGNRAQQLT